MIRHRLVETPGELPMLVIEYGQWELKWLVVLDNGVMDVMPAGGLPDDEDAVYETYSLHSTFRSLASPPASLATVAAEASSRFHARQLERLPEALRNAAIDTLVVGKRRIELSLRFVDNGDESAFAHVVLDHNLTCLETRVSLPRSLPASCAAFKEPAFSTLDEYVDGCREAFEGPRRRRKAVCAELKGNYALVDLDDRDFARIQLLVQLKPDDSPRKRIFVIDFRFEADFPAKPPVMTLRDFLKGGDARDLDRNRYLYSPRWDAHRVATELYDHACRQIIAGGGNNHGHPPDFK